MAHWFFREWINEWALEHRLLLHGGAITVAGCRPLAGALDPLPGKRGPVWDMYVTVPLALAGGAPSADRWSAEDNLRAPRRLTRIAAGTDA